MIESSEALRVAAAATVVLLGVGISLAWLPALRYAGAAPMLSRILITAGAFSVVWDTRGLGGVLGLALAIMGVAALWQSQPPPEVPRPRRKGIVMGAALTALLVIAPARDWWLLERVPDGATTPVAWALGAIGALGTLSIADRSRVHLREALRDRFTVHYPYPPASGEG
ncbi:MAG TPA: hypothetical protein VFZ85_13030 [Jiangellaceae bacterium]